MNKKDDNLEETLDLKQKNLVVDSLSKPNFGAFLEANKLGFRWISAKMCFIRISFTHLPGRYHIELLNWIDLMSCLEKLTNNMSIDAPFNAINGIPDHVLNYVVTLCYPLQLIPYPTNPMSFYVNMDGMEIYE